MYYYRFFKIISIDSRWIGFNFVFTSKWVETDLIIIVISFGLAVMYELQYRLLPSVLIAHSVRCVFSVQGVRYVWKWNGKVFACVFFFSLPPRINLHKSDEYRSIGGKNVWQLNNESVFFFFSFSFSSLIP